MTNSADLDRQRIEAVAAWLTPFIKGTRVVIVPRDLTAKLLHKHRLLPDILSSKEINAICDRVQTLGYRLACERLGIRTVVEGDTRTGRVSTTDINPGGP